MNEVWYILGTARFSETDHKDLLIVASSAVVITSVHCHTRSFGICGLDNEKERLIVTVGEDSSQLLPQAPSGKKAASEKEKGGAFSTIKIWEVDQLLAKRYKNISEYSKPEAAGKQMPRIIPIEGNIPFKFLTGMAVSKDLNVIAIGLQNGNIILIKTPPNCPDNLFTINEKEIVFTTLTPDKGFNLQINNIHILNQQENDKQAYYLFCTCESVAYMYHIVGKKHTFIPVSKEISVKSGEMSGCGPNWVILDSNAKKMKKYEGKQEVKQCDLKEVGLTNSVKVKMMGKNILLISGTEKTRSIRVYDMETEIIGYNANAQEVLAEAVTSNAVYLLLRGVNSITTQSLKEISKIEKLEIFMKKKHYDVAYVFARNENFSEDVLAEIARYYGDMLHSKVIYF